MRVQDDTASSAPSLVGAEVLARRLSGAVKVRHAGGAGGRNGTNGNGATREIALEVGASMLAEASAGTAEHSDDVVLIAEAIGARLGVTGEDAADLLDAARLHDIGKVWIPTRMLEKVGPLTDREWALMRQHTIAGELILSSVDELAGVARLVRHSHERWDGAGYPDGLAGAEIPLGSRIIFCADAFHAIRCDRPYRPGRSAGEALAEIRRCAGTQFDPEVATALEQVVRERGHRPQGGGGSARLLALLMCLVVGGAGSAIARSGLLPEPSPSPSSAAQAPPACGTAGCPTVAGPVGGLGAIGTGIPGLHPRARVLYPGLPGRVPDGVTPGAGPATVSGERGNGGGGKGGHAKHGKKHGRGSDRSHGRHGSSRARPTHPSTSPAPSRGGQGSGGSGGGSSGSKPSGNAPSGGAPSAAPSAPAGGTGGGPSQGGPPGGAGNPQGQGSSKSG